MARKLSASTIKYIPEEPEKFKAKFAFPFQTKFFKKEFVIGKVMHKIAELISLGEKPSIEDAYSFENTEAIRQFLIYFNLLDQ